MFQNQAYKQKLSYTQNENNDNVVTINIVLSTNHEIDKNIIVNISKVIAKMFIENYTNTDDVVQLKKDEKAEEKKITDEAKELIRKEKIEIKRKADEEKELIRLQKENDKRITNENKEFDKRMKEIEATLKTEVKAEVKKTAIPNKQKHWMRKKR